MLPFLGLLGALTKGATLPALATGGSVTGLGLGLGSGLGTGMGTGVASAIGGPTIASIPAMSGTAAVAGGLGAGGGALAGTLPATVAPAASSGLLGTLGSGAAGLGLGSLAGLSGMTPKKGLPLMQNIGRGIGIISPSMMGQEGKDLQSMMMLGRILGQDTGLFGAMGKMFNPQVSTQTASPLPMMGFYNRQPWGREGLR